MNRILQCYKLPVFRCSIQLNRHISASSVGCSNKLLLTSTAHQITIPASLVHCNVISGTASHLSHTINVRLIHDGRTTSHGPANETGENKDHRTFLLYCAAVGVFMVGLTYLMVPLYKVFCQQFGLGGLATEGHNTEIVPDMTPIRDRPIRVTFRADVNTKMKWNFRPVQSSVTVFPGETALAFFKARNPTSKAITGVATYNVEPVKAGVYFNKIQCFCFEEQRLNPHEEIDMPVFFFIDPEYDLDADLLNIDDIVLSYHFYEAQPGVEIPLPGFMQQHDQQQQQSPAPATVT